MGTRGLLGATGWGALLGLLVTAPVVALLYLADRLAGLPFVPYDLFDWTTRVLPGPLVTFGIDSMISLLGAVGFDVADTAKTAERASAVLAFVVLGVVAAALFSAVFAWRRSRPGLVGGLVLGAVVGLPLVAISVAIGGSAVSPALSIPWLLVVFLAWSWAIALGFRRTVAAPAAEEGAASARRLDRRRFLVKLGAASAVITVAGAGLARLLAQGLRGELADGGVSGAHRTETGKGTPFPNANDPLMPAPGTRPEYTPLEDHYSVFIRTEPSVVDGDDWRLEVSGLVDRPLRLTLDELRSRYETHDQYTTISCISGRVGTGLIGTTLWSGAHLKDVLDDAGLQEGARWLHVRSADGFYETVDLELLETADPPLLLSYDWDGHPLPAKHGFPLRIWIPDRYGMKQPKWIESMEVSSEYVPGYWVERKWDREARVKATSVVDTVAVEAAYEEGGRRRVPVGGIAFAGARGISRVEVRVDGGGWQEAKLRSPLSEVTWVIWRYDWPFEEGEHTFEVRGFEADGTPQIAETTGNRPDGATGIHSETVEV